MNDPPTSHSQPVIAVEPCAPRSQATPAPEGPFFTRPDWLCFGLTTGLTLCVYLYTLAPEVTLENSGMLATAARYGGVAPPPGFPLWTIYSWLVIKLVPFGNIAQRLAAASAVAGAVTCGLIGLLVSAIEPRMLEGINGLKRLDAHREARLRLVCGCVAGMGFGFNGVFWNLAVIVETVPFCLMTFWLVICLLVRWLYSPERTRYLYGAFLFFGFTVSASEMIEIMIPVAIALPFFVLAVDRKLARDLFFVTALLAAVVLVEQRAGHLPMLNGPGNMERRLYQTIAVASLGICVGLIVKTRGFLSHWRQCATAGMSAILGLTPYILLPLASMTNPPSNWGYAREVGGFFHLVTRGQFEHLYPTDSLGKFGEQCWYLLRTTIEKFGLLYSLAALLPILLFPKMRRSEKGLMAGLIALYLCLTPLTLFLLNPPTDRAGTDMVWIYLCPSWMLLALWAGLGLTWVGTKLTSPKTTAAQTLGGTGAN